jgi:hypothetical protein
MKKPRRAAALALVVLGTLSACSPVEHRTDKQAAMAQMTFSPEKCETVGAVYYTCNSEHSLPSANDVTESGKTTDTRLIRGICPQGFHYEAVNGCQKD